MYVCVCVCVSVYYVCMYVCMYESTYIYNVIRYVCEYRTVLGQLVSAVIHWVELSHEESFHLSLSQVSVF